MYHVANVSITSLQKQKQSIKQIYQPSRVLGFQTSLALDVLLARFLYASAFAERSSDM